MNEYEAANRAKKVAALLGVVIEAPWSVGIGGRTKAELADALKKLDEDGWNELAVIADVKPPSSTTISAVINALDGGTDESEGD